MEFYLQTPHVNECYVNCDHARKCECGAKDDRLTSEGDKGRGRRMREKKKRNRHVHYT